MIWFARLRFYNTYKKIYMYICLGYWDVQGFPSNLIIITIDNIIYKIIISKMTTTFNFCVMYYTFVCVSSCVKHVLRNCMMGHASSEIQNFPNYLKHRRLHTHYFNLTLFFINFTNLQKRHLRSTSSSLTKQSIFTSNFTQLSRFSSLLKHTI